MILLILFDTFVRLFVGLWKSRIIFPQLKNPAMFQFMFLGVVLGKKSSNDSRLTVITLNVVRHFPRASGPFLWELPAKTSRVEAYSTWRVLRGIDPRLVSIKEFESSKGTTHEMSWHQVWEKVRFFSSVKKKNIFSEKNWVFFITEEKTGFLKKNLQIGGFLMR